MLDKDLEKAKVMLNKLNLDKNLYMRIYPFATENINGYIDLFDLKNKSLLTVGSSGDQMLNSYYKGARDITLLDINPFAKYYINLKIAGIISFTYEEFQIFFLRWIDKYFNWKRFNIVLFNKLKNNLKYIDYDSYYFFNYIIRHYHRDKISDYLMNDDEINSRVIKGINNYLESEESFNKLKKILKDISFNFINEDIFNFQSNTKYDNIFLSNLCTLSGINLYQFRDLLIKIKEHNLNIDGSILIAYLWNTDFYSNKINFEWKQAYNMPATRSLLKDFITFHYNILGINNILLNNNYKSDLVMIYKKI